LKAEVSAVEGDCGVNVINYVSHAYSWHAHPPGTGPGASWRRPSDLALGPERTTQSYHQHYATPLVSFETSWDRRGSELALGLPEATSLADRSKAAFSPYSYQAPVLGGSRVGSEVCQALHRGARLFHHQKSGCDGAERVTFPHEGPNILLAARCCQLATGLPP
jgi:hypothetical protein